MKNEKIKVEIKSNKWLPFKKTYAEYSERFKEVIFSKRKKTKNTYFWLPFYYDKDRLFYLEE